MIRGGKCKFKNSLVVALVALLISSVFFASPYIVNADSGVAPMAAGISWNSITNDPVYGNALMYTETGGADDGVVTDETELLDAINAAPVSSTDSCIIPIANDITLTAPISITSTMNLVIRKVAISSTVPTGGVYYTNAPNGRYIIHKTWDYSKNYITTKLDESNGVTSAQVSGGAPVTSGTAVASPDLYDGEPDIFLTLDSSFPTNQRHLSITANNTNFVMENITFLGANTYDGGSVLDGTRIASQNSRKGGVSLNVTGCTLSINVWRSGVSSGGNYGAGLCMYGTSAQNLTLIGGVIYRCLASDASGGDGGGSGIFVVYTAVDSTYVNTGSVQKNLTITGTIIEQNGGPAYGGGITYVSRTGVLTLNGNTILRNNQSRVAGGILIRDGGTLNIADNAVVEGNTCESNFARPGGWALYPGVGGGIFAGASGNASTINISGNALIKDNSAMRGGGAIGVQNTNVTINITGGSFVGNKALGTYRELSGSDATDPHIVNCIGGGGAIYVYDPTQIRIPPTSTVKFAENTAEYMGVLRTDDLNAGTAPGYSGFIYNNYIQTSTTDTGSSSELLAPYDNLMNNYDIGIPRNLSLALYVETTVNTSGLGQITQPDNQQDSYYDLFGDGRIWTHPGAVLSYTAVPQTGNVFTGWTYQSNTPLTDAEVWAAFGASSAADLAVKLAAPTINYTAPTVHVTLTANFATAAQLSPPSALAFGADYASGTGYTLPAAQALALTNTGGTPATGVNVTLGDFSLNSNPWTGAAPFTVITGNSAIATGGAVDNSWKIQPASGLASTGVYTAIATISYLDGTGATQTLQAELAFALSQGNQATIVAVSSDLDFGSAFEGYAPITSRALTLQNFGAGPATVSSVSFAGANYNAFDLNPPSAAHTLPGRESLTVPSVDNYWSVSPKSGLAAGTYTAEIIIVYNETTATKKLISFQVQSVAVLAAGNIISQALETGYAVPAFNPVRITNTGQANAEILSITSAANTNTPGSSPFVLATGSSSFVGGGNTNNTNLLAPKTGLAAGTYTDTFTVRYRTVGDTAVYTVSFTASVVVNSYVWISRAVVNGTAYTGTSNLLTLVFAKPMKMGWADVEVSGAAVKTGSAFSYVDNVNFLTYSIPIAPNTSRSFVEGDEIMVTITIDPAQTVDPTDPRYAAGYSTYVDIIAGPLSGNGKLSITSQMHLAYYTLSYNMGAATSGTVPAGGSYPAGRTLTAANNTGNLVRTGYTFAGWTSTSGAIVATGQSLTMAGNTTLTARFTPNTYTLTFDPNGGTAGNVTSQTVTYGAVIGSLPTAAGDIPTRQGAVFKGWSYQSGSANTVNVAAENIYGTAGGTTVYAVWQMQYTLVYDKGTATTGTVPAGGTYGDGSTVTVADNTGNLARTGYSFAGWTSGAAIYVTGSSLTIAGHTTLTARFTPNTYKLIFDPNGGTVGTVTSQAVTYGVTSIALPTATGAVPTKSNAMFKGWSYQSGNANTVNAASGGIYNTAGDTTVYAVWEYALIYDKGAATSGTVPAESRYAYGSLVSLAGNTGNLVLPGYSFAGWTSGSAIYPAGSIITMGGNTTLTARFTPNTYKLIFDPNGGTAGSVTCQAIAYEEVTSAFPSAAGDIPIRVNGVFKGWSYQSGDSNTVNATGGIVYSTQGDTRIYAVWDMKYTLNYDKGNAASGAVPAGGLYDKNAQVRVSANSGNLALPGYSFAGWKSGADSDTYYSGTAKDLIILSSDIVMTAVFSPNKYTLTFDPNGGAAGNITSKQVTYDAPIGALPSAAGETPTRNGYTFKGWSSATGVANAVDVSSGDVYRTVGDRTVYAVWAEVSVDVPPPVTPAVKVPPAVAVKSIKAKIQKIKGAAGKKKVNLALSWKPVVGAQGYEVRYTSDQKFKKGIQTVLVAGGATKSTVIKNQKKLKGKNKYYAKIRAYVLAPDGKTKIYGNYPAVAGLKLKAGKGSATVKWTPTIGAGGYSIEYSLDKSFKTGVKKMTVKNGTKKQAVIKKLTKKKTYYIRMQAYQIISGKTVYDDYTAVKTVKIK